MNYTGSCSDTCFIYKPKRCPKISKNTNYKTTNK